MTSVQVERITSNHAMELTPGLRYYPAFRWLNYFQLLGHALSPGAVHLVSLGQ